MEKGSVYWIWLPRILFISIILFSSLTMASEITCSDSLTIGQIREIRSKGKDENFVNAFGDGVANNIVIAARLAKKNALVELAQCNWVSVESRQESKESFERTQTQMTTEEAESTNTDTKTTIEMYEDESFSSEAALRTKLEAAISDLETILCERQKDGRFRVRVIVWIPAEIITSECKRRVFAPNPSTAIALSSFLPGAGQFYKGDNVKGGLFLGAELAAVGGVVAMFVLRADALKNAESSRTKTKQWNDRADLYLYSGIGAAALLTGLHIWNIVDAAMKWDASHLK